MPEFLTQVFRPAQTTGAVTVALRLLIAMLLGGAVSVIYTRTRNGAGFASTFPVTLVLLAILIAMVTQVIGDNVARAFSLVGALSIVRFRTVVRDTRDTAFVIFAVVVGMAAGADQPLLGVIGLGIAGGAAYIMGRRAGSHSGSDPLFDLNIRLAVGSDAETILAPAFREHISARRLLAIGTARQGVSLNVSYEAQLNAQTTPNDLVKALNRIEGIQDVQLARRTAAEE